MALKIERIYTKPADMDGYRILIDRIWPRGISKENAALDEWYKDIAPSTELRKWFGHDPDKYSEFKSRYEDELGDNPACEKFAELIQDKLAEGDVILLYGAKDETHNQAVVLKEYLEKNL